jgi:hypothetical protein
LKPPAEMMNQDLAPAPARKRACLHKRQTRLTKIFSLIY